MKSESFVKKHPRIAIALINILILFFIFLIFEIALRIFTPNWLDNTMQYLKTGKGFGFGNDSNWKIKYKDGNFYSFLPNSSFKMYHNEYENTVNINSLGGRNNSLNETPDTTNVIPFIGDSFVMGVGVEDTQTLVSITQKLTTLNLLNLGVAGTCLPRQRSIINRRFGELGNPNIVIYGFFVGNDFDDIRNLNINKPTYSDSMRFKDRTELKDTYKPKTFLEKINYLITHNYILKRIYVLHYLKQKILNIKNNKDINSEEVEPIFHLINTKNKKYVSECKSYLENEIEILTKEPYLPIIIIIPDKNQLDVNLRKTKSKTYKINEADILEFLPQKILIEVLKKYRINYIDATECMLQQGKVSKLYYKYDNHLTPKGQQIIANCIADTLKKLITKSKIEN